MDNRIMSFDEFVAQTQPQPEMKPEMPAPVAPEKPMAEPMMPTQEPQMEPSMEPQMTQLADEPEQKDAGLHMLDELSARK